MIALILREQDFFKRRAFLLTHLIVAIPKEAFVNKEFVKNKRRMNETLTHGMSHV